MDPVSHQFQFGELKVEFPHESPYQAQRAIMANSIRAYIDHQNALLESPTGTGKSLALLAGALAYQKQIGHHPILLPNKRNPYEHHNEEIILDEIEEEEPSNGPPKFVSASNLLAKKPRRVIPNDPDVMRCNVAIIRHNVPIWYTSRTHTQLKQLVGELKKLPYRPQMTMLSSRKRICLNKEAASSSDPDGVCMRLVAQKACPYKHKKGIPQEFRPYGSLGKWDIEDLMEWCKQRMRCPYLLSREIMKKADLIFCPYSYLTNPKVKGQMMLSIYGVVLIIDEAHNIESSVREGTSCEHSRGSLRTCIYILNSYLNRKDDDNDWIAHISRVKTLFVNYLRYLDVKIDMMKGKGITEWVESNNTKALEAWGITKETWPAWRVTMDFVFTVANAGMNPLTGQVHKIPMSLWGVLEQLYVLIALCMKMNMKYINSYKLVLLTGDDEDSDVLKAMNVDPGNYFSTLSDEVNSVILSSGTLNPLNKLGSELGTEFKVLLSASHVIKPSQLIVATVNKSSDGVEFDSRYNNLLTHRSEIHMALGQTFIELLPLIPGGVLFFLPSHGFLSGMLATWERSNILDKIKSIKQVYHEEPESDKSLYEEYKETIESEGGAFLIGVCRGRMSEGIDFYDDQSRAVFIFGIPYPPMNDIEIRLKKEFNDIKAANDPNTMSGSEWYEAQAYRSLFQATGRCIRHQNDYGAIILMDSRFSSKSDKFPRWMQSSLQKDVAVPDLGKQLTQFYSQMKKEFPSSVVYQKKHPATICCCQCSKQVMHVDNLDLNDGEIMSQPGFLQMVNSVTEEPVIFFPADKQKLKEGIVGEIVWNEIDMMGYKVFNCPCGFILGGFIAVAKYEEMSKNDGLYLLTNRVTVKQGTNNKILSGLIKIKQKLTFQAQGKGQQVLIPVKYQNPIYVD